MVPIVILAAGSSSRLGKPKQNLVYNGQTLLQSIIRSACAASGKVMVVLGANFKDIEPTINDTDAEVIYNPDWALGMSSSIKQALHHIKLNYPAANSIVFTVCDQPYVNTALLKQLIETAGKVEQGIIACGYNDTTGVPALFKKPYFGELLQLNGQEGARKVIALHSQDVYTIPFALGKIDIDLEEDFNRLLTSKVNT